MSAPNPPRRRIVGVSTKMYFSAARTNYFVDSFLAKLSSSSSILRDIDVFIIPDHVTLTSVIAKTDHFKSAEADTPRPVLVGAQNCAGELSGPFTGEVSPEVLAEVGCTIVELGHAERRRLFGETDESTAARAAAASKAGLLPLVCVGEVNGPSSSQLPPGEDQLANAAAEVMVQVRSVLSALDDTKRVVLAYEPVWAIGASQPAPVEHVLGVVKRIRASPEVQNRTGEVRIVYGGSAGPGLFDKLKGELDGLFLGRFAHDPEQFLKTVLEVTEAE